MIICQVLMIVININQYIGIRFRIVISFMDFVVGTILE